MEIFQVGGCVRDRLLEKNPTDVDYVVVGSDPKEMLMLGFKQVGRDFPVYLHPTTGEEYALARQERLNQNKFDVFVTKVTLEEDLIRRDLTINAIAMDNNGKLIDPYGGCKDLAERVLRPTSIAFKEDPLRVLRAARFATTLGEDWKLDSLLFQYAFEMKGLYDLIPKERVYLEMTKAFKSSTPSIFFKTLKRLNVLKDFFPELHKMTIVEHDNPYHMEGSVFNHTMLVLDKCTTTPARIAALFHDVGKYQAKKQYGTFHGHSDEKFVEPVFKKMRKRYGFTSIDWKVAEYVALEHHRWQSAIDGSMSDKKIVKLLMSIRDGKFLSFVLEAIYADMEGRYGVKKPQKYSKFCIELIWGILHNHKTDCTGISIEQIKEKVYREKLNLFRSIKDE